jgi:putative redox protein
MNQVRVRHESGKLRQELFVGRHHFVADELIEQGGEDNGPSPFDFLASALGACTAITLRMYAQRKSWPLETADIVVTLSKVSDATKFDRTIDLKGALTIEQKSRLLEIANRCPVHRILTEKIEITTSLV